MKNKVQEFCLNETTKVIQYEDGIELLKDKEVFGLQLTVEELLYLVANLQGFVSPEIEALQKTLEEKQMLS